MAVSKQKRLEIEQRRQQVTVLMLKGYGQTEIGRQLGVSQGTICNDFKKIREGWRASTIRNFDIAITLALLRLDLVMREAWEAWERSKKPAQSAVIMGEGVSQPARKTLRNQNGDPRFLGIIRGCIADFRAMLGLDAPKRTEPGDEEGRPITLSNMLKHIAENPPPPPPASPEPLHYPNVIDIQEMCRQIAEMPDTNVGGGGAG